MFVFWWTGRGYLTAIVVFATLIAFALVLQASQQLIPDQRWYWGLSFLAAAGVNWKVGSHLNRIRLARLKYKRLRDRLFYRAANRFMFVPMETFSIVIALFGLVLTVYGIAVPEVR